jgi:hypothetical protein
MGRIESPAEDGGCVTLFFLDALATGRPVQCIPGRALYGLPWRRSPGGPGPRLVDEAGRVEERAPGCIAVTGTHSGKTVDQLKHVKIRAPGLGAV